MCGIAGILDARPGQDYARALRAMTDAQAHRGPDGEGQWRDDTAWLGHRRLAILDLTPTGHQPMTNEDQTLWLVFNGEIYNYRELAVELRAAGHAFRSTCDTEVILHAYEQWGEACVERFNGMWAFALWDTTRRRLFASRDRMGIKPFHYAEVEGRLLFASEAKALLASGLVAARPEPAVLAGYLADGYVDSDERTFFAGLRQLLPGHCLSWEAGRVTVRPHWPSASFAAQAGEPATLSADELRALLQDAVALRLRSDVPVGTCLSGGMDSSTILALAHAVASQSASAFNYHSFTATFANFAQDESAYVRTLAERFRCQPHYVTMSGEDLRRDLPALTRAQEIPVPTGSLYAQWQVMAEAHRQGLKVLLDGQGGDEVFAGYPLYFPAAAADLLTAGRPGACAEVLRSLHRDHRFSRRSAALYLAFNLLPGAWQAGVRHRTRRPALPLGPALAAARPAKQFLPALGLRTRLGRVQWQMLRAWQLPALLHFEDRSSMAFSIETRLPLLDYRVVELGLRLPVAAKVAGGQGKAILRQAMRGLVPDVIIDRRDKIGFAAPDRQWEQGPLGDYLRELAASATLRDRGWLAPDFLAEVARGGARNLPGPLLWRLAGTELWARTYLA
jgi:asparagine synthase (glutamine-hydrolysing)